MTSAPPARPELEVTGVSLSPGQLTWRRFRSKRVAQLGAYILLALYAGALFADFIAPYDFELADRQRFFHPPTRLRLEGLLPAVQRYQKDENKNIYRPVPGEVKRIRFFVQGTPHKLLGLIPTRLHLFGTGDPNYPVHLFGCDQFGRDVFSRLLYGSRISLSIGLVGITLSMSLGVIIGAAAGYFGGWSDNAIMRLCEIIMSIPALYLIMALQATFPPGVSSTQKYLLIVIILSLIRWAGTARVIRGMALSLRERQFVLAARALGQTTPRIIFRHLVPATASYLIVAATLSVPYYILGEVVLSVVGVGIQEPEASWGNMLEACRNYVHLTDYPWLFAPGVAIFITVLAFNFLGDGLRDAVDTKS